MDENKEDSHQDIKDDGACLPCALPKETKEIIIKNPEAIEFFQRVSKKLDCSYDDVMEIVLFKFLQRMS